jgi:putative PIN family toxin of toxin-antitoxin system
MADPERVVLDTNVVVSGMLFPGSIPSQALFKTQKGRVLASEATNLELLEVLKRSRFDRYIEAGIRNALAAEYLNACELIPIPFPIHACRDPRDDKFLEVAVYGRAGVIVSGDADLLALHPFRGVAILTPAEFLDRA